MTATSLLLDRNRTFSRTFDQADQSALPKLGTLILTCIDARVDPAHVLGLNLGEAVVFRNNGGRVTRAFIHEVAALSVMVAQMTGAPEAEFGILLMQHTKCGAQSFADPAFQALVKDRTGVDVSPNAITDQCADLLRDIDRLRDARQLPDGLRVSAVLYDVDRGVAVQIAPERTLKDLRGA